MRWIVCVIVVALAGCDEEDDFCDPNVRYMSFGSVDTHWIEYVDNDDEVVGDHGVAVGGTERYSAVDRDDCGSAAPSPEPISVLGADSQIATASVNGALIDVHGVAAGSVTLTIKDLDVMTDRTIPVKAVDAVRLVADENGEPGAFYAGSPYAKIQLLAQGDWVVDRGLSIVGDLAQGSAWDLLDLSGASVGEHAVTVTAGGSSWPVTATITDHVDAVVAQAPAITTSIYGSPSVCFYAHDRGVVVAGVPWTFDYDPDGGEIVRPNCVEVWRRDDKEISTTVTAHALGFSATTTVTFAR